MNVGRAIKLCRTQKDLKQAELAALANISVSYLSLLEQGKRDPTFATLQDVSAALNIPISILVFLAAEKSELEDINPELAEKISHVALKLIEASANESSDLSKPSYRQH